MGPPRHLVLLGETRAEIIAWPVPFADGVEQLMALRGRRVAVLASGDPFWFGAGSVMAARLSPGEWRAYPGPSCFALAAARLGWPLERTACFGLHAAPFERLRAHLAPGARAIATLRDGAAVGELAAWLTAQGFGLSSLRVMEALGGPRERIRLVQADACALAPPLARLIDHTVLKPDTTETQIRELCAEAREYCFASVCVSPVWVPVAASELAGTTPMVCTVIGFPHGATRTPVKAFETAQAVADGADEIDMVLAIALLKSERYAEVEADIRAVVEAASGRTVKVILETALLTDEEKVIACVLAQNAGADFAKTSDRGRLDGRQGLGRRALGRGRLRDGRGGRHPARRQRGRRYFEGPHLGRVLLARYANVGTRHSVSLVPPCPCTSYSYPPHHADLLPPRARRGPDPLGLLWCRRRYGPRSRGAAGDA